MSDPCFTRFASPVEELSLPEQFTFPFYYQPHPLCELAAEQLQQHLATQQQWQHDFGLQDSNGCGKMFGVLVVKNTAGELGFLSAFSGKIADQNLLPGFVPPVFDMLTEEGFFRRELADITDINQQVKGHQANPRLAELQAEIDAATYGYQLQEQSLRQQLIVNRAERKQQRQQAESMPVAARNERFDQLARQSVADKNALKHLKQDWQAQLQTLQDELDRLTRQLEELKQRRGQLSNQLQNKLFRQYRFLNQRGETRDLMDIFSASSNPVPPAGSGECCAPKLLQYAYQTGLQPLAMAEFWWGTSPKSEIRQHKKFYPSCQSKCQPILSHMLQGLDVEPNPLEQNWAEHLPLEIVYQDEAMVVVNKPAGLLSVPGKTVQDSVYTRLQAQFADCEGPIVVHRLDMATSGLLVFALTRRANKSLQKQFISRRVAKRYVALIEGSLAEDSGTISLPMRGDPDDRPRQLVCFEHGKPAETFWQRIDAHQGQTKLYLYPKTGRTHQLRVHCAHHLGLNSPMVGDGLYGQKADRLHLHAERLEFDHPYTKQAMVFQADADF